MNFICQDVEELGNREITTMQTLVKWSGKKEEEIINLLNQSKDGFVIDGYRFKEYLTEDERRAIRDRKRYQKSLERQKDRERGYITDGVEWGDEEKPNKIAYEVDGVKTDRKEVVKALRTNSTTLMKLMRKYKQLTRNGRTVKAVSIQYNAKIVSLYKNNILVKHGTVKEIAKELGCSTYNIYKMYLNHKIVNGYEVKESVDK